MFAGITKNAHGLRVAGGCRPLVPPQAIIDHAGQPFLKTEHAPLPELDQCVHVACVRSLQVPAVHLVEVSNLKVVVPKAGHGVRISALCGRLAPGQWLRRDIRLGSCLPGRLGPPITLRDCNSVGADGLART